jgi:NAD(P)-dependent dehydrogenase (short-subunit alcohol dehydrogenase family)
MKYSGLAGRSVLITGGTRGIGYAVANAFLEQEAEVHVTGTKKNGKGPLGSIFHSCDFSNTENLEKLCDKFQRENIEVLINNAGINKTGAFAELSPEDFLRIQQVNLYSPFRLIQAVLPDMTSKRWGRIVNITSIFSIISKEFRAPYSASKFGLDGMTASLAAEVAESGVLVNSVAPGFIDTELTRKHLGEKGMREMASKVPIRRMGNPEEVARLVLWLASNENTFVSGQNIAIDGGFTRV